MIFSELVRVGDFQIVDLSDSRLKWACTVLDHRKKSEQKILFHRGEKMFFEKIVF